MKRYLARKVLHRGREHGLSVVTIEKHADNLWHVDVEDFVCELCSTIYYPGTLSICDPENNTLPYEDGPLPPALIFLP